MRTFVILSGVVFALIFLAHIARVVIEGTYLLAEPIFAVTSVGALAMAIGALMLARRPSRS